MSQPISTLQDLYFGPDADYYRAVHAAAGVETAQYLDDLWTKYQHDPSYEHEWRQVNDFYFRQHVEAGGFEERK